MEGNAIQFASAAKALSRAAHRLGVEAPAFRSPPRPGTARRTVRRSSDGVTTVAVAARGRPWPAVVADMIDGIVVANGLDEDQAGPLRDGLWASVTAELVTPSPEPRAPASPRTRTHDGPRGRSARPAPRPRPAPDHQAEAA